MFLVIYLNNEIIPTVKITTITFNLCCCKVCLFGSTAKKNTEFTHELF